MKQKKRSKSSSQNYFELLIFVIILVAFIFSFTILLTKSQTKLSANSDTITLKSSPLANKTPTPTQAPYSQEVDFMKQADASVADLGFCVSVPILFYHHIEPMTKATEQGHQQFAVDPTVFEHQLAYLQSYGYKSTSVDQIVNAIQTKTQIPEKSVVLTFDDGYLDFYEYAFPLLKRYGFSASLMLATGLIENAGYMSWAQVREVLSVPEMSVYNHTWSHAALGNLTNEQIEYEITTAKKDLLEKLGKESTIFTYPYGSFTQGAIDVLRKNGYIAALSTLSGTKQCEGTIMYLRRLRIGNTSLSFYGL